MLEPLLNDLLKIFSNIIVQHIFRETNQCVDALARLETQSRFKSPLSPLVISKMNKKNSNKNQER